jgi:hypothetical protein
MPAQIRIVLLAFLLFYTLRYAKCVSIVLNITVFTPVINNWCTCKHYYSKFISILDS